MRTPRRAAARVAVLVAAVTVAVLAIGAGNAFGGQIKICKSINPGSIDSLRNKTFTFTITTNHPSYPGPYYVTGLRGGECALVSRGWYALDIPHIRPNLSPTQVTVTESTGPWVVQSIGVSMSRGNVQKSCTTDILGRSTCQPWVSFDLAPGVNIVSYTNRAAPLF
jgi:hypothetical protein